MVNHAVHNLLGGAQEANIFDSYFVCSYCLTWMLTRDLFAVTNSSCSPKYNFVCHSTCYFSQFQCFPLWYVCPPRLLRVTTQNWGAPLSFTGAFHEICALWTSNPFRRLWVKLQFLVLELEPDWLLSSFDHFYFYSFQRVTEPSCSMQVTRSNNGNVYTARYYIAAVQCIVIGPVCLSGMCVWVCYHDNSKVRASILTKLSL